jgi:hypothetical protein
LKNINSKKGNKMKKFIQIISVLVIFLMLSIHLNAQVKEAPDYPPGGPSGNDGTIGEGAPIGSGLIILISLGAAYAGRKIYLMKKEDLEE